MTHAQEASGVRRVIGGNHQSSATKTIWKLYDESQDRCQTVVEQTEERKSEKSFLQMFGEKRPMYFLRAHETMWAGLRNQLHIGKQCYPPEATNVFSWAKFRNRYNRFDVILFVLCCFSLSYISPGVITNKESRLWRDYSGPDTFFADIFCQVEVVLVPSS
ncbi:unnamed protein product [Haemonchus placei]|uniref:ABC2_membrane domain-containing protein n=1 Tax=Haemonchus placei TaxID=6290 RepID=A0A0N4WGG8_HAEPC|nr:unnamed protein product [Haemonchus placei]